MGHTLQDYFVFKDKLHELINKNTVELDTDMRAATTNAVFVEEDMVDLISPQDNEGDNDDEGDWVISESMMTHKKRLHTINTGSQYIHSSLKRA